MTLDGNAIRGMLGYLTAQEGGLELLQYRCEHATDHEFCRNDDDWMFRQAVLQAKDILPDAFRVAVWYKWCYQQKNLGGVPVSKECIPNCPRSLTMSMCGRNTAVKGSKDTSAFAAWTGFPARRRRTWRGLGKAQPRTACRSSGLHFRFMAGNSARKLCGNLPGPMQYSASSGSWANATTSSAIIQ